MSVERRHSKFQEKFHGKYLSTSFTPMSLKRLNNKLQEKFHRKFSLTRSTPISVKSQYMPFQDLIVNFKRKFYRKFSLALYPLL